MQQRKEGKSFLSSLTGKGEGKEGLAGGRSRTLNARERKRAVYILGEKRKGDLTDLLVNEEGLF